MRKVVQNARWIIPQRAGQGASLRVITRLPYLTTVHLLDLWLGDKCSETRNTIHQRKYWSVRTSRAFTLFIWWNLCLSLLKLSKKKITEFWSLLSCWIFVNTWTVCWFHWKIIFEVTSLGVWHCVSNVTPHYSNGHIPIFPWQYRKWATGDQGNISSKETLGHKIIS